MLADPESEEEVAAQRLRHGKRGSPEAKHIRLRSRQEEELQQYDIVHRQPDGNYLLGESHGATPSVLTMELQVEEEQKSKTYTSAADSQSARVC